MRAALPLLLAVIALSPSARADEWFGSDKALHFGVSAAIASGSYALTTAFTDRRSIAFGVGAGVALGAGVAKESWDALGHGDPSWKDFTWDVVGTIAGLAFAYGVDLLVRPTPTSTTNATAASRTFDRQAGGVTFRF